MRSTVSSAHGTFTRRIKEALDVLTQVAETAPHFAEQICQLKVDYDLNMSACVCAALTDSGDAASEDGYWFAMNSNNYNARLAAIISDAVTYIRSFAAAAETADPAQHQIRRHARRNGALPAITYQFPGNPALAQIYKRLVDLTAIDGSTHTGFPYNTANGVCECGDVMQLRGDESVYVCGACGASAHVGGTAFREEHCSSQEGPKARNSDYNSMRHFDVWLPRILGIAKVDIPAGIMERIRHVVEADRVLLSELTVTRIRAILRDHRVRATVYNDHTTYIIKQLGGAGPPEPTFAQQNVIRNKYKIVMDLYFTVESGTNIKYYPYFIYKIIEIFFQDVPSVLCINNYIHLQSKVTLDNNDAIFRRIINQTSPGDGFRFIPTDSTKKF